MPKAAGGQSACLICGVTATITLYEPDPDSPGGRRWASYCDAHDPDPPAAEAAAT